MYVLRISAIWVAENRRNLLKYLITLGGNNKKTKMEDIFSILLNKPLAFIITIGGVIFLGLSGLNKVFKIEINPKNSKRLFIAGLTLVFIGIPIYYFGEKKLSADLDASLLKIEFFNNDSGHNCNNNFIHIRETYKIKNAEGEKFTKVILKQGELHSQEIKFQDNNGNFVVNYCFRPNFERTFRVVILSSSGKSSNVIKYNVSSKETNLIQENAPALTEY